MINITNKVECCGCQACGDICPKDSITFETDEEGIWYPKVNMETCIDCHLCEKVCPIINKTSSPDNSNNPITYILQAPNPIDRLKSASGGAYTLLAQEVLGMGGYVAGHIWDSKYSVKGYISCKKDDLDILRGTKYLQSNIEGMYNAVKRILNEGHLVLFSGCPCQVAAMRSFLKRDYDNLLMTDFVCMGIDSPLAFQKYIESLENLYRSKMVFFKAKSKEVGWRYLTNKAVFENGKSYFGINGKDANLNATFLNVLVRPSCYECKFKGFPRNSDITIGDYWRRSYHADPMDDNTGTSYAMLHNEKAVKFFERIKSKCYWRKSTLTEILGANRLAIHSLARPQFNRSEFYKRLHREDFISLVNEYSNVNKCKSSLKGMLKKRLKIFVGAAIYNRRYPLSFLRFVYYNLLSSKVHTNWANGDVLMIRNTKLSLREKACINVKGFCIVDGKDSTCSITISEGSTLNMNENLLLQGVNICSSPASKICLGYRTIINPFVYLHASANITIGDFSVIGQNAILDTEDNGIIYFDGTDYHRTDIVLGTHTLIERGAIVQGGTTMGDETIVKEFSVIKGNFEHHAVIAGVPAKVINNNINWKHNFDFIWNYKN